MGERPGGERERERERESVRVHVDAQFIVEGRLDSAEVGTPFLMYYGPAWCQRVGADHPDMCLRILASVLQLARQAFDESSGQDDSDELIKRKETNMHRVNRLRDLRHMKSI